MSSYAVPLIIGGGLIVGGIVVYEVFYAGKPSTAPVTPGDQLKENAQAIANVGKTATETKTAVEKSSANYQKQFDQIVGQRVQPPPNVSAASKYRPQGPGAVNLPTQSDVNKQAIAVTKNQVVNNSTNIAKNAQTIANLSNAVAKNNYITKIIGTAPVCEGKKSDCAAEGAGWYYAQDNDQGCWSGHKVECRKTVAAHK